MRSTVMCRSTIRQVMDITDRDPSLRNRWPSSLAYGKPSLMVSDQQPIFYPALLWAPMPSGTVQCNLCAHRCLIKPGKRGICGVRENRKGELFTLVYGMATSLAVDPIEKKPLFHFLPGSKALSIATVGCNFGCLHCQNHSISQWPRMHRGAVRVPGQLLPPEAVVAAALESHSSVIAYTYTEPTIYLEYALDTARLAASEGIKNVFVTNGYLTAEAVALVAPFLHGANVDLKGVDDRMLRREVKAISSPVRRTIEDLHRRGVWVEVTTLIIPGSNDDDQQLTEIARFIASVSPDLPWHVSRFHPTFRRQDRPPTPTPTMHRAREIGQAAGLNYVYAGNLWGDVGESTFCPACHAVVIVRHGFELRQISMKQGHCGHCGEVVLGVGMP
jgi:pyruvate formate lyase activating enzyme